jgi:hypothetical protein
MSKIGLAYHCAYGFREDVTAPPRQVGRAARIGSAVHAIVESIVNKTPLDDTAHEPDVLAEAFAIAEGPLAGFLASRPWTICEVGYRYDSSRDTCERGPRRGEDGYDDVPTHVLHGTVDLVHIDGEHALCADLKTGKPPEDAEQLYAQAVAISRAYGVKTVRVQYARALKTKLEILNDETLDADRLDAEAGRQARLLRVLPSSDPTPGPHCWKCDAWQSCPAKRDDRGEASYAALEEAGMFG